MANLKDTIINGSLRVTGKVYADDLEGTISEATTVNGHTVESDVPANAKFTDTIYTGSNGVTVSGTTISNSGVRSIATGDNNGTIKVNTNGTSTNVSVKGLAALAYKASLSASDVGAIATSAKGTANGVAELDANGKVPSSQLPSYVDDVLEYSAQSAFPSTGETGKIYIAQDTNKTYRWSGSAYVEISASLALGTTSSTAYRGDYGNTAYTHATDANRLTTAKSTGLYKIATTAHGHVQSVTAVAKSDITALGIPAQDTTYSSKTAASGGTDVSLVTTGEKYIWNNKSTLTIGTSATTAAAGNHTHTASLATDTGTSAITLAHGGKYKLTAGGSSVIFTMPTDNNTWTALAGATSSAAGTAGYAPQPAAGKQDSILRGNATWASMSDMINTLSTGDSDPTDNDYYISQYASGGTTTTSYHRRPVSKLYNYIKTKLNPTTGDANGQIKIGGTNVSVKGLGSAAYTASTNYATSGHTHTTSLATDTGTSSITLAHGGKYKLTAGGNSVIFTLPSDNNTTYSAGTGLTLSGTTFSTNVPRVAKDSKSLPGANKVIWEEYTNGDNYNLPTNAWYYIMSMQGSDTSYGAQLALGMTANAAYYRVYNATTWGSWKSIINTDTNTKVTVSNTNPTSGTWYYPVWYTDISGTGSVNANDGFRHYSLQGTASAAGRTILQLGNATATGTAGNKYGEIRIYAEKAGYATLKATAAATAETVHTLPNTAGTILNTGTTSFTQTLTSGTEVGKIKINGTTTTLYAPTNTNTTYTFATGDSNGQIKVTPSGGSAQAVSVKGLAGAAYKGVDTSMTVSSTSTNVPTTKAVADLISAQLGNITTLMAAL